MTNEPTENSQPTPPIVPESEGATAGTPAGGADAGQHDFGDTFSSSASTGSSESGSSDAGSSEAGSSDAPSSEGASAEAESPDQVAPEPVSPPSENGAAAPIEEPIVASAGETQAYPQAASGGHEFPGAPAYPGATQAAPNAPVYDPNAPVYDPNAPVYDPNYPAGAYPGAAPAAPKKPMSKGLLFGIIGGAAALVLLIAAAIIVPALIRGAAPTASDAVENYLTALSEGDAETALTFIENYGDTSLLTDEVLAVSQELAPITDIVVEEPEDASDYGATISASFAIGDETIEREFTTYKTDDEWLISDGLVAASLANFTGLDLTVNGATPADDAPSLFPGTYQLALGYEQFSLDSDTDTFTVTSNDDLQQFVDIRPVLTEDGAATFRTLVRAAIEECVAMKTLATPCGMDLTGIDLTGYTPTEGSVTRTITADGQATMDAMEVEVDFATPTLVSTYDTPTVDMTLQGTKDGTTAEFEVLFGGYMNTPSVDFSEETPTVTWE